MVSGYCFFLFCSRVLHEAAQFHSWWKKIGNRSFACWFCLDFSLEIAVQTNRSKGMYKGNRRIEVCLLFGRQKHMHTARHRNYRHVLNLRSRYCWKTKKRLPPINYSRIALPPKRIPPYFGFAASAEVVTAEKWKTAYRQKITAVVYYCWKNTATFWFYRFCQSRYLRKRENRQPPKNYRCMAIPPCLCPPRKPLPTTTLDICKGPSA